MAPFSTFRNGPPSDDDRAIPTSLAPPAVVAPSDHRPTQSARPMTRDFVYLRGWLDENKKLHINFERLAKFSSEWKEFLRHRRLDWSDPEVIFMMAKCTLDAVFHLDVILPLNRLCPTIPSRFEYIQFLQGLMDTTGPDYIDEYDEDREVIGVDIGVGASCIYPLLGCVTREEWKFVGTECDVSSFQDATSNIRENCLADRIQVFLVDAAKNDLIPATQMLPPQQSTYPVPKANTRLADFTMTNPPFYASIAEMQASAALKAKPAHSVNTGAYFENITPGGELAFVGKILRQSLILQESVQWYTALFAKYSSLEDFVKELGKLRIHNWVAAPLQPGQYTRRWIVAWSFEDYRPRMCKILPRLPEHGSDHAFMNEHLRPFCSTIAGHLALNNEVVLTCLRCEDPEVITAAVEEFAKSARLDWRPSKDVPGGVVVAYSASWRRFARRERKRKRDAEVEVTPELALDPVGTSSKPLMVAKVFIYERVILRWVRGEDRETFRSFVAVLTTKLEEIDVD